MKLSHFSRGDTFVSNTALTGVNGTHVSDSDYPKVNILYVCVKHRCIHYTFHKIGCLKSKKLKGPGYPRIKLTTLTHV